MRTVENILARVLNTLAVITLLLFFFAACEKEEAHNYKHNNKIFPITIGFDTFEKTKSSNISHNIVDVNLFIFNDNQELTHHLYLNSGSSTTLEISYGNKTIAAIANVGNKNFSHCTTLANLRESVHSSMAGTGGNTIFSGQITQQLTPSNKSITIPLTRMVSKITYLFDKTNLDPLVNISITKIQLINTPSECYYLSTNRPNQSKIISFGDFLEGGNLEPSSHDNAAPLYMFENMQGTIGTNSNIVTKHPGSKESVCTYVEITADYTSPNKAGTIKYKNFLGSNTTNNYDITRGKHYKETIKFNGSSINETSWRVDVSNLHEIPPIEDTIPSNIAVTGISIDQASLKLITGNSCQLHAAVSPVDATNRQFTWRSSNPSVVSVNPFTGMLLANRYGLSIVTVKSLDGSFEAHCTVNVYDPITLVVEQLEAPEHNPSTNELIGSTVFIYLRANLAHPSNMTIVRALAPYITVSISYSYIDKEIPYYRNATLRLDSSENNDSAHLNIIGDCVTISFTYPASENEIRAAIESISFSVSPGSLYIQNWYVTW